MKDVFRSCDSSKKFKIAEGQWYRYVFFQAEDGIRVLTVTGVQTCALPISRLTQFSRDPKGSATRNARRRATAHQPHRYSPSTTFIIRSEERRVGKECRTRMSLDHQKNMTTYRSVKFL